jgi:hypothetical protein
MWITGATYPLSKAGYAQSILIRNGLPRQPNAPEEKTIMFWISTKALSTTGAAVFNCHKKRNSICTLINTLYYYYYSLYMNILERKVYTSNVYN